MKISGINHESIISSSSINFSKPHKTHTPSSSLSSAKVTNFKTLPSFQQQLFTHSHPKSSNKVSTFNPKSCLGGGGETKESETFSKTPSQLLRNLLKSPGTHQGPACYDGLSAKLVEKSGFDFCFMSGFSVSAARLGLPDVGLISYGEMVDQGRQITEAVSIPVIGDGDNGYGNGMNVKRTVKGFIKAGFAGIIIEDQVSPKACGHTQGRKVVSREEAVMRIKAAIDARKECGSDIVIVARTDSRQAVSFEESLWRSRAFADAGADVLFIDALASREEMEKFCEVYPLVPKMANMLEGGGKTPILNPIELDQIGFKIVSYPLSLIGVSVRAMQDALTAIKGGRLPPPGSLPSFEELKETLGFNAYYEEDKVYATRDSQSFSQRASSSTYSTRERTENVNEERDQSEQDNVVEVVTPEVYYGADVSKGRFSGIWSRTLRVKVTGKDGSEKLGLRIPAGFLDGITNVVPALGGVNIKSLLDDAAGEPGGKKLLDFNDTLGDRIQVFLE
ncbi:hypothetical protein MKW94_026010 [Papaver nudicaule]|uniref:Isocitrate lyase n=1 Tax=Papaver nudicaule TaxID=74823 RepID=A0AA41VEE9_PAPNU|nr:hypothetical protein [Papaver nudicaule]